MRLVTRMISLLPRDRPTVSECLQHPWLIENSNSNCKKNRSLTSNTNGVLPSKQVRQSHFHKNITDDLNSTGISWQFDSYLEDESPMLDGQFGEPGRTSPAIQVDQPDVVMAEVPYQSIAALSKD